MARLVIKKAMQERGVSQYRLAQILKMDAKNLSRMIGPDGNITFYNLNRIARALGLKVRDLIKE